MSVKFVLIINPKKSPPKGGSEKREKKGKNAVDSGHYVLPATAKGSARNLLRPKKKSFSSDFPSF